MTRPQITKDTYEIVLKDVRSFAGTHTIPIRPLTILVGENSTGKTSLLAFLSALNNPRFPWVLSLSESPFSLSSFDTIVTRPTTGDRPLQFSMGIRRLDTSEGGKEILLNASYTESRGQPSLSRIEVHDEKQDREFAVDILGRHLEYRVNDKRQTLPLAQPKDTDSSTFQTYDLLNMIRWRAHAGSVKGNRKERVFFEDAGDLVQHIEWFHRRFDRPYALAPIRSKPRRTYDELAAIDTPEGDHVPGLLHRSLPAAPDGSVVRGQGPSLGESLDTFGISASLFSHIDIRRFGTEGDPFQIVVKTSGREFNLKDVGYGVSQALPVIVQSILARDQSSLILQQPEVHLHPRAQAELGTLFAGLCQSKRIRTVIETHSDYLVDRIRYEIRRGNLDSKMFQILYFEQKDGVTTVYPITADDHGNLRETPSGYRAFFLEEERRILGFE